MSPDWYRKLASMNRTSPAASPPKSPMSAVHMAHVMTETARREVRVG